MSPEVTELVSSPNCTPGQVYLIAMLGESSLAVDLKLDLVYVVFSKPHPRTGNNGLPDFSHAYLLIVFFA